MKRVVVLGMLVAVGSCSGQADDAPASRGGLEPIFAVHLASREPIEGWNRVPYEGRALYLKPEPVVADAGIDDVAATRRGDSVLLDLHLGAPGAARLGQVTAAHTGEPLALVLDSRVVEAPVIRSEISGGRVQMGFAASSEAEAERILELIRGRWPSR